MAEPERIEPQEVMEHKQSDEETVLVCAYDDEDKFQKNHLAGAISLDSFKERLDTIEKDREIAFYCA